MILESHNYSIIKKKKKHNSIKFFTILEMLKYFLFIVIKKKTLIIFDISKEIAKILKYNYKNSY